MRALMLASVLLAACADDLAARDYTLDSCPPPVAAGTIQVCDRGAGQSPRFTTIEACSAELGFAPSSVVAIRNTHPSYRQCLPGVALATIEDVRNAQRR